MNSRSNPEPSTQNPEPSEGAKRRLRVLISAYACEPGKGSEPGCGWNYVLQLARYCDVTVLTRANNRTIIQEYESRSGNLGINWIFYDLPGWVLGLKRKLKMVNVYYLCWQWFSVVHVRRKLGEQNYDLLHHLTFGSYSRPTFLFRFNEAPLIWGPIGGVVKFKTAFLRHASLRARLDESIRFVLQKMVKFNPMIHLLKSRTALLLGVSSETLEILAFPQQGILSQVGIDISEFSDYERDTVHSDGTYVVMMAGRFLHWKGFSLGLEAFSHFLKEYSGRAKLVIVGDGPERIHLKRLASKLKITNHVEFVGNVSRRIYFDYLADSDAFLFPSSHEPGSYVVAEALAIGVPVVCSSFGEPCTLIENGISGYTVELNDYKQAVLEISTRLIQLSNSERSLKMCEASIQRAEALSWESRGAALYNFYLQTVTAWND